MPAWTGERSRSTGICKSQPLITRPWQEMHLAGISGSTEDRWERIRKEVIDPLLRVEDTIGRFCPRASELWSGYISYNLSCAFEKMYAIADQTGNLTDQQREEWIQKIRAFSQRAVRLRQQWIKNGMKGIFSTALSFEYFLAMKHEYERV